ncbi:MAG: HAMP domain-containing sensor histidine kinase [bacterium]|nr:HAMP domain-containing sensor histidine kinase [bacterium]
MAESGFSDEAWLDVVCQRQRLDVIGDLTGGIAHQLNNALSVVTGYEELLLEALEDGPAATREGHEEFCTRARTVHTWTGTVLSVARRLHEMATNLRDPACPVVVNDVVSETIELCRYRCERENVLLIAVLGADLPTIRACPGDLLQVLTNLVYNAREAIGRAGEDGGTIRLTTTAAAGGVCIVVDDDGPGVVAGDVDRIFAVGVSTKTAPGSGFGLPVSRRIIQRSGGTLRAQAAEGGRFLVEWPAAK